MRYRITDDIDAGKAGSKIGGLSFSVSIGREDFEIIFQNKDIELEVNDTKSTLWIIAKTDLGEAFKKGTRLETINMPRAMEAAGQIEEKEN